MQMWWLKFFDEPLPKDLETNFRITAEGFDEPIYTIAIGWSPPFEYTNYTKYLHDGDVVYIYVDIYPSSFQIGGLSPPTAVYRYTLEGGAITSCEDVSGEFSSILYYSKSSK